MTVKYLIAYLLFARFPAWGWGYRNKHERVLDSSNLCQEARLTKWFASWMSSRASGGAVVSRGDRVYSRKTPRARHVPSSSAATTGCDISLQDFTWMDFLIDVVKLLVTDDDRDHLPGTSNYLIAFFHHEEGYCSVLLYYEA